MKILRDLLKSKKCFVNDESMTCFFADSYEHLHGSRGGGIYDVRIGTSRSHDVYVVTNPKDVMKIILSLDDE